MDESEIRRAAAALAIEIEDALAGRSAKPIDLNDPLRREAARRILASWKLTNDPPWPGGSLDALLGKLESVA